MSNATSTTEIIINNANINQWLYIIFFIGLMLLTIYRLYLVMTSLNNKEDQEKMKKYVIHWILFISALIFWGSLLIITMIETTIVTYSVLQYFSNFFLLVNIILMVISVIISYDIFSGPKYSKGNGWTDRF
jgi:hypothetical protein